MVVGKRDSIFLHNPKIKLQELSAKAIKYVSKIIF